MKYFATNDYLLTHLKKRHPDFYVTEIKHHEKKLRDDELGEVDRKVAEAQKKDSFFNRLQEEVVDKY